MAGLAVTAPPRCPAVPVTVSSNAAFTDFENTRFYWGRTLASGFESGQVLRKGQRLGGGVEGSRRAGMGQTGRLMNAGRTGGWSHSYTGGVSLETRRAAPPRWGRSGGCSEAFCYAQAERGV